MQNTERIPLSNFFCKHKHKEKLTKRFEQALYNRPPKASNL